MSDMTSAPDTGGGEAISVITSAESTGDNLSVSQAARALQAARYKDKEPAAEAEAPEQELSVEDNAAPVEEQAPGETQDAEPAAEPPIERPRSWTKDEDAEWQSLPRATQQKIVAREQERDAGLRRSQNEAAEKLKGLSAKEQAVEQARERYEQALPALLQTLQNEQAGAFSDIRSVDDVTRLAVEDPFRFNQFQAHQMKLAAVQNEIQLAEGRKSQEKQTQWSEFAAKQDALLMESVPELADKAKAAKLSESAIEVLRDRGFADGELGELWTGQKDISLRDHRIQQLIIDAVKYRESKATAATKLVKPVPQVQRPGVSQPRGAADAQNVQTLSAKLERTGSLKDAAALLNARREAGRRAS